jgi:hypothetical protein
VLPLWSGAGRLESQVLGWAAGVLSVSTKGWSWADVHSFETAAGGRCQILANRLAVLAAATHPSWLPTRDHVFSLSLSFSLEAPSSAECRQAELGWAAGLGAAQGSSTPARAPTRLAASILRSMALLSNRPGGEDYAAPRESESHQPSVRRPTRQTAGALGGYCLYVSCRTGQAARRHQTV